MLWGVWVSWDFNTVTHLPLLISAWTWFKSAGLQGEVHSSLPFILALCYTCPIANCILRDLHNLAQINSSSCARAHACATPSERSGIPNSFNV